MAALEGEEERSTLAERLRVAFRAYNIITTAFIPAEHEPPIPRRETAGLTTGSMATPTTGQQSWVDGPAA